ncbi:peptidyl-prolyl cis-trans isomerase FKBP8-like [Acipenser ruthenus]|uniref:peptidyl-prolyl cis-trans isomerase FKBP8-like n=1 Tax=Acipenser ruthenus TaxID=7906 RepID=UPI0027420706|nr:peptidyl-prolyl cis-trans isomerase FKBP8-like [Acipenser ruthenus]
MNKKSKPGNCGEDMEKPEFDFKVCPDCEAWVSKEEDKKQPVKPGETEESRGEASSSSSSRSSALESLGVPGMEAEDGNQRKTPGLGKTVRFQVPPEIVTTAAVGSSEGSFFQGYDLEDLVSSSLKDFFEFDDWLDITEDKLLRKKVLTPGRGVCSQPKSGQEVTVKVQGMLEDGTIIEKDPKLTFVIGDRDVNQALELCAPLMQKDEIALLITSAKYAYGQRGRDPDIPADASLLYELQLLEVRERPSLQSLSASDCIRIGSQKRERGNYYFQREEYQDAFQSYSTALQVLSAPASAAPTPEHEELRGGRVKCLNNLAAVHIKLERYDDALETSSSVLELDPDNVKALFRKGKLLSDKGEFQEAMETLKKALKLEPSTKAIHLELSKLVKKQTGDNETPKRKPKPTHNLGESLAPFPKPLKKNPSGIPWELLLAAIVVAVGTLVTSMILSARN